MPAAPGPVEEASFVARESRFVTRVRRRDGTEVRAHLPNTARLHDVLLPDRAVVIRAAADPGRRTAWTLTRVWDGTWVALEAAAATDLVAGELAAGRGLPGWPAATSVRREVAHGPHRFDLAVTLSDGRDGFVEVTSLSRAVQGRAPLSATPSQRGSDHLAALAAVAEGGGAAAAVFVVQRDDVEVLDLAAPAESGWTAAVRTARDRGVHLAAYAAEVTPDSVRLGRALVIDDEPTAGPPVGLQAAYAGSVVTLAPLEGPGSSVTIHPRTDGRAPGRLPPQLPARHHLHVLTACNPRSRLLSVAENQRRTAELAAELQAQGVPLLRADGGAPDGSWQEPGFAVIDRDVAPTLALARRFDQLAIFELTATALTVRWTTPGRAPLVQGWEAR